MIVYGDALRPWLEAALGDPVGTAQFIGRAVGGELVAVVAFHNWTGENIEMSCASLPGGATRGFLDVLFAYAFGQLGCVRCTARIHADNMTSMLLVHRLGFVLEGVLRKAKAGQDVLIFGLLKEELIYGRRRTKTPSGT